jgi:outer membrane protein assembly factor BamB
MIGIIAALALSCSIGWGADWLTDGGDSRRTAWQRDEGIFTKERISEMKLLWKIKLDNQPRQMHSLFPPLIVGSVSTSAGPKEIAIVTGVSDNIYAIDVKTGAQLWKKHFENTFTPPEGARPHYVLCPGGITATPVIGPTDTAGE